MTNRELLELAALAAGYKTTLYTGHVYIHDGTSTRQWNPLENDGDAFRLMVRLNLSVRCFGTGPVVDGCYISYGPERITTDLAAATRLAIVRCAAEIGRRMKEQK